MLSALPSSGSNICRCFSSSAKRDHNQKDLNSSSAGSVRGYFHNSLLVKARRGSFLVLVDRISTILGAYADDCSPFALLLCYFGCTFSGNLVAESQEAQAVQPL